MNIQKMMFCRLLCGVSALLLLLGGCAFSNGSNISSNESTSTSAPEIETVDLMEMAIGMSGYAESGLDNQKVTVYGADEFRDYRVLQSNPLQTADYVMCVRKWADMIQTPVGMVQFATTSMQKHGVMAHAQSYAFVENVEEMLKKLFGGENNDGFAAARAAFEDVVPALQQPLARFLSVATEAYRQIRNETDDVTPEEWEELLSFTYCTPASSDVRKLQLMRELRTKVSETALRRAGVCMLDAAARLSEAAAALPTLTVSGKALMFETPLGAVCIGSTANDTYNSPQTLLLLEPYGDDTYNGRVASNLSMRHPLSVVIDLRGNDTYAADELSGGTQGCGVLGAGVLLDLEGNDTYTATRLAQGCCLLGVGILYDGDGNDAYDCAVTGQAAGFYGYALLADQRGNDIYHAYGFAQASAGNRCQAYLVDSAGNDSYYVEPELVEGYEALIYDQFPTANGNWSQGCGWGQRYINVAGGIAGLVDLSGDDAYEGAIWVQGTGYWSGVGFLTDTGGNDRYISSYYSQSSVAHYGVAALIDVGGNDHHELRSVGGGYTGLGASLSFVWDHGTTVLVDDGGDDIYMIVTTCGGVGLSAHNKQGYALQDETYAVFIDTVGKDIYSIGNSECWGFGRGGYFLDIGGKDSPKAEERENNMMANDLEGQFGGVYIDYDVNAATPERPVIGFWERAKAKAGLS